MEQEPVMDFSSSMVAAPVTMPAPKIVPDMRPAADAAATVRITKPELPLGNPTPPANSQVAAVSRSMLGSGKGLELETGSPIAPVTEVERTLKPYGISMLPQSLEQANAQATATKAETDSKTAESTARTGSKAESEAVS
jgi:hypothetical protein